MNLDPIIWCYALKHQSCKGKWELTPPPYLIEGYKYQLINFPQGQREKLLNTSKRNISKSNSLLVAY